MERMTERMTPETEPRAWLREINRRPIGRVEFREVTMRIGSRLIGRKLTLRTLRLVEGDTATSLFCVTEPFGFRNINYVAREELGRGASLAVQLYLPYVRGTLKELEPERLFEGMLGSQLCYDDFRVWFPEDCYRAESLDRDGAVMALRCTPVRAAQSARPRQAMTLFLHPDHAFVLGADYASPVDGKKTRELRIPEYTVIDSVTLPQQIVMRDAASGDATTIELVRAWYDRDIDPGIFDPSARGRTRDYLLSL